MSNIYVVIFCGVFVMNSVASHQISHFLLLVGRENVLFRGRYFPPTLVYVLPVFYRCVAPHTLATVTCRHDTGTGWLTLKQLYRPPSQCSY